MSHFLKNTFNKVETKLSQYSIWQHFLFALVAFGLNAGANAILNASYAASKFPVPYAEGQTAFSGETIKGYYAYMIEQGSLGIYWQTQFIDFLFIASMALMGLVVSLFFARLHTKGSWLYKLSMLAAIVVPMGALFDALENFTSFAMLAQPLTFPNWIALIYSSFASVKFACIAAGYIIWAISLIGFVAKLVITRIRRVTQFA